MEYYLIESPPPSLTNGRTVRFYGQQLANLHAAED